MEKEGKKEENLAKGIDMFGTNGSSEGDRSPPSLITREMLCRTGCVDAEEGLESDMYLFM